MGAGETLAADDGSTAIPCPHTGHLVGHGPTLPSGSDTPVLTGVSDADEIATWAAALAVLAPSPDDAGRIDQIRLLEDVKAGCAAAQARITAAFAASQRAINTPSDQTPSNQPDPRPDASTGNHSAARQAAQRREKARRLANRSAAAQIALARRESPTLGGRYVGLADALVHEMPGVLAALQTGVLNEWRATIIVRETACLTRDQRTAVDTEIAGKLDGLGNARIEAMVKAIAYRIDPDAVTRRAARAAGDRRVTLRPQPDVMGTVGSLLPMPSAVACMAALRRATDAAASDDTRTRDQRMADEFVARLTGTAAAGTGVAGTPSTADSATPSPAGTLVHHTPSPSATTRPAGHPAEPSGEPAEPAGPRAQSPNALAEPANPPAGPPNSAAPSAGAEAEPADTGGGHRLEPVTDGATDADTRAAAGTATHSDAPAVTDAVAAVRAAHQHYITHHPRGGHPPTSTSGHHTSNSPPGRGSGDASDSPGIPPERRPAPDPVAADTLPPGTGIQLCLVMTDRALLGHGNDPALLDGRLPIPAPLARSMIANLPATARTWIQRLYTRPDTGELVTMDTRRRTFTPAMRRLLFARDQHICRTPWCDAPARHADHVQPSARGGPTSIPNGQSLSEDCNYAREAPGWHGTRHPDGTGTIHITTPTGHTYPSPAPDLIPGHTRPRIDLRHGTEGALEYLLEEFG